MKLFLIDGVVCACGKDLPFAQAQGEPEVWLYERPAEKSRASFVPSAPGQLTAGEESPAFLDPARTPDALPESIRRAVAGRTLRAVNLAWPGWRTRLRAPKPPEHPRAHIVAMGDVGGTMALGLRLLGGGCIEAIGLCDVNEKAAMHWEQELGQVRDGWGPALPPVEIVSMQDVFACDILIFAATKGVPPVGTFRGDARMAQLEANRGLVRLYARMAREKKFGGLFCVVSDPVDPLAFEAFRASNEDEDGRFDGLGLPPEQIQGFGLGVMHARGAYYAEKDARFQSFLTEGRAFGPHGNGLVLANSVARYDDGLSRELTALAAAANVRMRELGYKPFVAPALSSAALPILHAARGEWHDGSVFLGGAYFGCKNRYAPNGQETEALPLPEELYARMEESYGELLKISEK
jgi:hypothetical protein